MPRATLLVLAIMACKGKQDEAAPRPAPPVATRAVAADAGVADASAPAVLALEPDPANQAPALAIGFANKIPRLPALSADARELASFEGLGGGPMFPQPVELAITAFPTGEAIASLPLLTIDEATKAAGNDAWATPELQKQLATRATAVLARLRGFRSLDRIELAINSNGIPQLTKLGELALAPTIDDAKELLTIELRGAKGAVLQRAQIEPYEQGTRAGGPDGPIPCNYRPSLNDVYRDPLRPMIYLRIGFRYSEECDPPQGRILVWSLDPAAASPVEVIRDLVSQQFNLVGVNSTERDDIVVPDADVISANFITTVDSLKLVGVVDHAMDFGGHDDKDVQIAISRDGKSAWASELTSVGVLEKNTPGRDVPWRASDVLTKTPKGWRIAALAWTEPRSNAAVNSEAKAGKLVAATLSGSTDAGLVAAFAALTTQGVDADASTRADLVAIGSGPGERTVGGAIFARAWNAGWKGKVAIVSSVARAMPSGTTGWVAATIELAKPGAKLPFTVFCIFDKTAAGAWSLVHVQLSVAAAG